MVEPKTRLLLGLGNPTASYQWTRHNAGRLFVEYLLTQAEKSFTSVRQADIFRLPNFFGVALDKPLLCVQLQCFMNESGPALERLLQAERLSIGEVMVVLDDFMLPLGTLRLRADGSSGGHNGLRSLIDTFGSDQFARLRIGIGPLPEGENFSDFVLKRFSVEQKMKLPLIFEAAKEGLKIYFETGLEKAQAVLNKNHL